MIGTDKDDEKKDTKYKSAEKSATAHNAMNKISDNCNDILVFLNTVTVKDP